VRGKGREEKGGKKKGGKMIEQEKKYISQLKIRIHGQIKSQSAELVFECWSDSVIVVPSPINVATVVVVVAGVIVAGIGVAVVEPRLVSTRGLRLRVAQAGAMVGHDALESPAAPP
jgi:hypothetical protein